MIFRFRPDTSHAALFLSIIFLILCVNAWFVAEKSKSNLQEILWEQGKLIATSVDINARRSVDSMIRIQQQMEEKAERIGRYIDRLDSLGSIKLTTLKNISAEEKLYSLSIINQKGEVVVSTRKNPDLYLHNTTELPINQFSVFFQRQLCCLNGEKQINLSKDTVNFPLTYVLDIPRENRQGVVRVALKASSIQKYEAELGLQKMVVGMANQDAIKYVSFLDENFRIFADSEIYRIGEKDKKEGYQKALRSMQTYYIRSPQTLELVQPFVIGKGSRAFFRIGLSTNQIDRLFVETMKNTAILSLAFMVFAIISVIFILRVQFGYSKKIEKMHKRMLEREKLASLGNLAAGVAHEIRNPLNTIGMCIQRIQLECVECAEKKEEFLDFTGLISKEVERLNRIITDFLGFSKPYDLKKTEFNVGTFIKEIALMFSIEAQKKSLFFLKEIRPKDIIFFGDKEKLTQVLFNVLQNALKATPPKGEITIRSVFTPKNEWCLEIKDTGCGVPKENSNKVFDIYYTTDHNGSGLGLYLSQKIVEAHGGTIELIPNATNSVGTTVRILLPVFEITK